MTTIGTTYDPLDPAVQAEPYVHYAALRCDAPLLFVDSIKAFVVSRHSDVRHVLHDDATFSNQAMADLVARPAHVADDTAPPPVSIIGTDGALHARLRKIVNRAFTPRRVAELERAMRESVRLLLGDLAGLGHFDLQTDLAVPFPSMVIAAMLGVDPAQRADFRRWAEHMVLAVFEPHADDHAAEIVTSGEEMGDWLDTVIVGRAGTGGDDLISTLLRAELDGGALTHDELRVFVFTLLVAGVITTAYLIGNAVRTLATDPHLEARVRADGTLVPRLVEESLRHDPPVQMMFRTVTRTVTVAGSSVPAGATVAALIGSANRDDAVFDQPDAFDVDRDTGDSLAFGHGAHFCLGAALARLEARVAIEELIAACPRLTVDGDATPTNSLVFRGPSRLPIQTC